MPRNSSGTYSLPSGNPVVSNTLIQSTWANTTMSDLGSSITDSLDRSGRGAMLAPLKNTDGTQVAPAMTFSSEGTLGIYRVSAGVLGFAAGGVLVLSLSAAGLIYSTPLVIPQGTAPLPSLTFTGNTNTGIYSPGTNQVSISTAGVDRLAVGAAGTVTLSTGALVLAAAGTNFISATNAAGTLQFQTGGANTRLTIDAAGNSAFTGSATFGGTLGIGGALTLPNATPINWRDSGATARRIALVTNTNAMFFGDIDNGMAGANLVLVPNSTGSLLMFANAAVGATLTPAGNFGIGVSPSTALHVQRSAANAVFRLSSSGGGGRDWNMTSYTTGLLSFGSDLTADQLGLLAGNVLVNTTTSTFGLLRLQVRTPESTAVNTPNGFGVIRAAVDSTLWMGYNTTPDAWLISATYNVNGSFRPIMFCTSDTVRMTLDTSGNFGIGVAPAQKLAVNGGLLVAGAATLGVSQGAGLFSYEAPVFRTYIGDGTGYSLAFSRRVASTTTDLFTFSDSGAATFTGSLTASAFNGNASTATALQTARTIGGVSFNGTANIIPTTVAAGATDGTFELGWKDVPPNSQVAAYTLVLADRGKGVYITTGGVTVPQSIFSLGNVVTIVNNSATAQTITQGTGVTLHQAGTTTTGNRTLLAWGIASVLCLGSSVFAISGNIT